jgi:hypothetical protein
MNDVRSTTESLEAIGRMQATLNGGLIDALIAFINDGDILSPDLWAGPHADAFRSNWNEGGVRAALVSAKDELPTIVEHINSVNVAIQEAGGN